MWAADTNILVRYYTKDDPKQAQQALTWLQKQAPCYVPITVIQELYWVLTSTYSMPKEGALNVIAHAANSPAFQVESVGELRKALKAATNGLQFPDALHWALSSSCNGIATFDNRGFARRAKRLGLTPAVALLS